MTDPAPPDKPLFTPGPLTTSRTVKEAMLSDLGSRDAAFIQAVREIRSGLLALAGVSQESGWEAVLMQGSGTFSVESVLSSSIPAAAATMRPARSSAPDAPAPPASRPGGPGIARRR